MMTFQSPPALLHNHQDQAQHCLTLTQASRLLKDIQEVGDW